MAPALTRLSSAMAPAGRLARPGVRTQVHPIHPVPSVAPVAAGPGRMAGLGRIAGPGGMVVCSRGRGGHSVRHINTLDLKEFWTMRQIIVTGGGTGIGFGVAGGGVR